MVELTEHDGLSRETVRRRLAENAGAEAGAGQSEPRKKRPVMPCGIRRNITRASAKTPSSPATGLKPKDGAWLTVPKSVAADTVPAMTEAPP
jgi:hypothetical protein